MYADIHPTPPDEDMPAEAVPPPSRGRATPRELSFVVQPVVSICDWLFNQSWRSAIGRTISRVDLRLVVQSVVAISDWSYNQSCRSAIGRTISRVDLRLVVQSVVVMCDWSYKQSLRSAIGRTTSRGDLRLVVRLPMTSLAINLRNRTTSCRTSRQSNRSV